MLGQTQLFAETEGLPLRRRVAVELATTADVRAVLEQRHYLRRARVGRQLNYLVYLDGVVEGVVTYAYPMMSATLEDIPPGELVEFARLFLARNIPHVASCAIGKSLRRLRQDWQRRFPDAPPLRAVVSWSDTTRHVGTVYKAANFRWLKRVKGQTHGNSAMSKRGVREPHSDYRNDKDCWLYTWSGRRAPEGSKETHRASSTESLVRSQVGAPMEDEPDHLFNQKEVTPDRMACLGGVAGR